MYALDKWKIFIFFKVGPKWTKMFESRTDLRERGDMGNISTHPNSSIIIRLILLTGLLSNPFELLLTQIRLFSYDL